MPVDWLNVGEVLGTVLAHADYRRRLVAMAHDADGVTFLKDDLGEVFGITDPDQVTALANLQSHLETSDVAALRSSWSDWISVLATEIQRVFDGIFVLSDADRSAGPYTYQYDGTLLAQGQPSVDQRFGFLAVLRQTMIDEGEQVQENAVTFGPLTAVGTPDGALVLTSATGQDFCLTGTFRIECTSDIVEAVQLSVTHDLDDELADGTRFIVTDNPIQVGQDFADETTGLTAQLDLDSPIITGDTGALFSLLTVTNPTEGTSDKGRFHVKVTRQTGDVWLVEVYRDSSRTSLVGSDATASGVAGLTAITIQTATGSVAVTIDKTAAAAQMPVVGNTYSTVIFDILIPRIGDKWTFTSANDGAGSFASKLAQIPGWRIALPSGAVASASFNNVLAPDITLP